MGISKRVVTLPFNAQTADKDSMLLNDTELLPSSTPPPLLFTSFIPIPMFGILSAKFQIKKVTD